MKKIITYSLIALLSGFLFSSCRSNLTIIKRHYNKGYYVASSKNEKVHTVSREPEKQPEVPVALTPDSFARQNEQSSSDTETSPVRVSNVKEKETAIPKVKRNGAPGLSGQNRNLLPATNRHHIKPLQHKISTFKKSERSTASDEALSLFWIIILIILILWAVGLLAGGFGGLINILLVIALILLILWLLRIL